MKLIRLIIERIKYENEEWPDYIRRYRQGNLRERKSGHRRGTGKVNMIRDEFHENWNYTIGSRKKTNGVLLFNKSLDNTWPN